MANHMLNYKHYVHEYDSSLVQKAKNRTKIQTFITSSDYGSNKQHLKDHTSHFACLSLIYSIFIHVTLLTIISQSILLER
ncbi:hypothetical protein LDENG_00276600 [Lucifuga dentata]|nr:hypothetical protein LDENG_00276600 [Lucifuga dentata]